jgi:CubicO group peptidase (beta-lactamase class C family)
LEDELKKLLFSLMFVIIFIAAGCGCPAPSPTALTPAVTTTAPVTTTAAATPSITTPAASTVPAAPTPSATAAPVIEKGTLEQRLNLLVEQMEQQRQTVHIPGMALAVVKDDKIVLARGFGVSDLAKSTPVTPETVFPIGSCTKAFTSALVGMMVDEGKMGWDDPVTRYLPYFKLNIQTADPSAQLTLTDVMSHRSGFPRMGILTASSKIPIEEVLQDASAAVPYAPFRQRFYYSNEVYMSAGVAAAKAAGTDWETLVKQRILVPLGMNSTTVSYTAVQKSPNLSLGYLWDADINQYKLKPMRNVDNIAPAGAINSTVLDMAQWLRLQLGNGVYQEKRLISAASISQMRQSNIQMSPGIDYGLGWMIRSWKDKVIIEHGGNVDGFSAEVAMVPESGLGFVLLTNSSVNTLQEQSITMFLEALLGEWQEPVTASSTEQFQPYLGTYIANFGPFRNAEFKVLVQNNHLAVDIPGQMVFELNVPDAAGKWYFRLTDQISVSFTKNDKGQISGMKLYQSGIEFEIPKKGFEAAPEIPLADLQKYLGSYHSDQLNTTVTIEIQNNHLAVNVPGQMVYELLPPDKEGKWFFRITNAISLGFHQAAGGEIDRLTMYQGGQETVMVRVEGVKLPSVEEILALRQAASRESTLKILETLRIDYNINIEQSGVKGQISLFVAEDGKYRAEENYGKYGKGISATDGQHAWVESDFGPFEELDGKLLANARLSHPAAVWGDWRKYYDTIRVVSSDNLNGKTVYVVELKQGDLPLTTLYLDSTTGDILLSESYSLQEGGISIPMTTVYEDYRDIQGLRLAYKETTSNEQTGRTISTFDKMEAKVTTPKDFFTLTPPAVKK